MRTGIILLRFIFIYSKTFGYRRRADFRLDIDGYSNSFGRLRGRAARLAAFTLLLPAAIAGGGCGSSDSSAVSGAGKVPAHPVEWELNSVSSSHTIEIRARMGFCVGDPNEPVKGRIIRADVREGSGKTHITAYAPNLGPGFCADVLTEGVRRIHLEHPLKGQVLYDGATSPAAIRWPDRLAVPASP
jgi:hypothetical protein